jgi:hypothetical protein
MAENLEDKANLVLDKKRGTNCNGECGYYSSLKRYFKKNGLCDYDNGAPVKYNALCLWNRINNATK